MLCLLDDRCRQGDRCQVLVSPDRDTSSLAQCLHEETDRRLFVHSADAANRGHKKVRARTVDTDVVVLAISVVQEWMNLG